MKKVLSILLTALMLVSAFSMLAIGASAADAPSGQIWEGESDLRRDYTVEIGDWSLFYLQNNEGYNDETAWPNSERPSMNCSGFWKNSVENDELAIKLDVKTSGKKTFYLQVIQSSDFGIFDIYFDDTLIADNLDLYIEKSSRGLFEYNLGQYDVTPGEHTLRIKNVGKNELSTNYVFLVDYFEMVGEDGVRRTKKIDERDTNYGIFSELEDGTIRYEGESLPLTADTMALIPETAYLTQIFGKYEVVLSYNAHFMWRNVIPGDEVGFEITVPEDGEYEITISSIAGYDYGMAQWFVNGEAISDEVNYYIDEHICIPVTAKVMLKAGVNTLSMLATGADERSTNFILSLDYVDLKKVGEYVESGDSDVTTPVEDDPAVTTPTEEDPADTTPVEDDPADTTPVENDPADTTPVENDPAVTTPADDDKEPSGGCGSVVALSLLACLIPAGLVVKKKRD